MQDSATTDLVGLAENAKAWPFEEARRLLKRLQRVDPDRSKTVVFETGYGPSGLPHIGTFGEVARTSMVRHAFEVLTDGAAEHAADLLFRRYGRAPQGPGQYPERRHARDASRPAPDGYSKSVSKANLRVSPRITTENCGLSSTNSGSTTSSSRRRSATPPA
jgi:hypothetical protein